jgi:dTDP-4-amino-4,6-dideoxygalactose transaminase
MPLHAAVLREKLKKLGEWISRRREIAQHYGELLSDLEIILPYEPDDIGHVYRNYTVRVKERDQVRRKLAESGIPTGMHYTPPLHLQPVYEHMGYGRGALPITEKAGEELLTLPMYPELTEQQVKEVADALEDCVAVRGRDVR